MLRWLLKKQQPETDREEVLSSPAVSEGEMLWLAGTSLPIPDWGRQPWAGHGGDEALHAQANGLAAGWLDAMMTALGAPYVRAESGNFMLLSSLDKRARGMLLDYLERSQRRVLGALAGIAVDHGHGKTVVMVFDDEETYYRYVANYGRGSSQPEASSGGMFIDHGYGHFVFPQGTFESMEPVVVHELAHCLVRHLPLPAWLDEGLAVNTEHRFTRHTPRYRPNELEYLFSRFWDAFTIQEFWSGKSFLRPDDGQALSYELARLMVQLLGKDYELLTRFCETANQDDGGQRAAQEVMGAGLEDLVEVVLGPGTWKPDPGSWADGTEKGQFQPKNALPEVL
jgi:hypothetical protein